MSKMDPTRCIHATSAWTKEKRDVNGGVVKERKLRAYAYIDHPACRGFGGSTVAEIPYNVLRALAALIADAGPAAVCAALSAVASKTAEYREQVAKLTGSPDAPRRVTVEPMTPEQALATISKPGKSGSAKSPRAPVTQDVLGGK